MNEMIERVARAICVAYSEDYDDQPAELRLHVARAAIGAMREPTTNQFVELALMSPGRDRLLPAAEWSAMIDAALAEDPGHLYAKSKD